MAPLWKIDNSSQTSELLRRIGRRVFWPHPTLYAPIGSYRRGVPTDYECDLWVGGYPRSGNTFLWKSLEAALPDKLVIGRLHVPPMIIRQLRKGTPGVFVVRDPLQAVVSWSIYTGSPLRNCLDYYVDFHHVMWRSRRDLLVKLFDTIINHPDAVIEDMTTRFNLANQCEAPLSAQMMTEVMKEIESMSRNGHGEIDEMKVSRPSAQRRQRAQALELELRTSPRLQPAFARAGLFYERFRSLASGAPEPDSAASPLGERLLGY